MPSAIRRVLSRPSRATSQPYGHDPIPKKPEPQRQTRSQQTTTTLPKITLTSPSPHSTSPFTSTTTLLRPQSPQPKPKPKLKDLLSPLTIQSSPQSESGAKIPRKSKFPFSPPNPTFLEHRVSHSLETYGRYPLRPVSIPSSLEDKMFPNAPVFIGEDETRCAMSKAEERKREREKQRMRNMARRRRAGDGEEELELVMPGPLMPWNLPDEEGEGKKKGWWKRVGERVTRRKAGSGTT